MTLSTRTPSALAAALRDIQAPVRDDLAKVSQELWRIVSADVPLVNDVQEHLMGMKGKLFRPTLLLLSSSLEREAPPRAITFAAIIELIHVATLVHDDAVDHSVLRRGRPTVNALFSHQVSVIMGDYLYLRALRELVMLGDLEAMKAITQASNEMTLGELRQLAAYDALAFSESDYDTLIRAKTASLFMAACEVGAVCGAPAHRRSLLRFGERLGMAFQVADDLLDYTEGQEMTGKPSGHDLKEHKVTLPLIAALREMDSAARGRVESLFADPEPDDEAIAEVVELVRVHGGLDYARRRADQFSREAEESLADLPDGSSRTALADAIAYVVERRW
ncbi:MAG: polyprenyl synthetase family protein [Gemmatimonadota bacterium]|jgi:octaprenyl-diphosphate synthase|nr:polyprenyl synthetase family protein [Gemmatimonadota bacterium]MDQ8166426.1 polyprenyl synthetase family protein [Gemmatimonadota bacterium]MDQ8172125.1 polyprenyl synthetase family protein [Gemmatimonadota bacterium]